MGSQIDCQWFAMECGPYPTCAGAKTHHPTSLRCPRVFLCLHACYFMLMLMYWLMLAGPSLICQMGLMKKFRLLSMLESVDDWLSFSCTLHQVWFKVPYEL